MTPIDLQKALHSRNFFRFTGPPENWLTAVKYMTWGLEEKYLGRWKKIKSGDVFLMHSTTGSAFSREAKSSIVGLGVVGGQFRIKKDFLWIQEMQTQRNIWPLLVPFSEIYLFSDLSEVSTWEAPGIENNERIKNLIMQLLNKAFPLKSFNQNFPVMGSWSSVRPEFVDDIFHKETPTLYNEFYKEEVREEAPEFERAEKAEDTIRYVPSLKFLEGSKVKVRKNSKERSIFERDNSVLERAEENHQEVLQAAIDFFRNKGFDTWFNQHVDLLAKSEDQSFLIEVKSTVNSNFRPQARKAVGQLFEYEYFDVRHHFESKSINIPINKVLMVSDDPKEGEYPGFLDSLKIQVAWPQGTHISARGEGGLQYFVQN